MGEACASGGLSSFNWCGTGLWLNAPSGPGRAETPAFSLPGIDGPKAQMVSPLRQAGPGFQWSLLQMPGVWGLRFWWLNSFWRLLATGPSATWSHGRVEHNFLIT